MLSRRQSLTLVLAASLLTTGCLAGAPATPDGESPTVSDTESDRPPSTDGDGTATTPGDGRTVEYAVRAGEIPDEFRSVRVTLQVVFVTDTDDFGPCYPEIFTGPYEPTITPLPTPAGECYRSETVTVDLADLDGERSVSATVPDDAVGYALLVTDVAAVDRNGTEVTTIKGIGGREVFTSSSLSDGPRTATIGIGPADPDARYDYWLLTDSSETDD